MRDLADIQRRFHAIATDATPLDDAAELIRGEHTRISIYRRMYRDRLIEAIAGDYPKLVELLGHRSRTVIGAYLRECPPADPDIHHAGRRLPAFLAQTGERWEQDLAKLEWARAEVFFGPDALPLTRGHLSALAPADFPNVRLRIVPASAFLELGSNADDLWSAVEDKLGPPPPEPATRSVVVWRRGAMAVVHRTLDVDEAHCARLLATGATFSDICESLANATDPAPRAIELLLRWVDAEMLDAAATGCC